MKRLLATGIAAVALAGCAGDYEPAPTPPETSTATNESWSCENGPAQISYSDICTSTVIVDVDGNDVECVRTFARRFEGGGVGISCNWNTDLD